MYDVIEVNLATKLVTVMATSKDLDNAEAYVKMAVVRRGMEESFFVAVAAEDNYKTGDKWVGHRAVTNAF